ncbi:hypothetical protein CRE_05686 [Caenorhabditis remanei]|uniref:Uncharacterized protein n=1 Tax=Caenorhabditis remanei TaxID=31234 RepID=E3M0R3_CAERE|nr:hypothetical protein CRE_05686 [Caenorhabditis remanei]
MRGIHIAQYTSFVGAQLANSFLIYLIITRSDKQFGDFRYIMGLFAFYAMFYAWVEIFTQPVVSVLSYVHRGPITGSRCGQSNEISKTDWSLRGLSVLCLFGLCISLLATQFYYRYLALCKPKMLEKVSGRKLPLIFIPAVLVFVFWYINVLIGMADTYEKDVFLWDAFQSDFSIDSYRVAFVACMLWKVDENGVKVWNLLDCVGALTNVFIIALIPFILMYCPVGLLYVFPFFELEVRWLVSIPGLSCCIYPSVEPLIAIFCLKGFRNIVLCKKGSSSGYSISNPVDAISRSIAPKYTTSNKVFVRIV